MATKTIKNSCLLFVAVLSCACGEKERPFLHMEKRMEDLEIVVEPSLARSAFIADENKVNDLNIWIYSSTGLLREHHFLKTSFDGSGTVSIETMGGAGSRIVVLANRGVAVEPPLEMDSELVLPVATGASDAVLMLGQGRGFDRQIVLGRVMSRLSVSMSLSPEMMESGAVMGGNVHVSALRLCNAPRRISFNPSDAFSTARTSMARDVSWLGEGDRLSESDIAEIESGGKVFLYTLPNYAARPMNDVPAEWTELCTYVEIELSYDSFGSSGQGRAYHRFYVSDGLVAGMMGGCNYNLDVRITPNMAIPLWRKDDYRFFRQDEVTLGTVRQVDLVQAKDEGSYWFSLAPDSMVTDDGIFRIKPNVSGGRTLGVTAESLAQGSSEVYIFNGDPVAGAVPLGRGELRSVLPELSVAKVSADVTGEEAGISIYGRPDKSECASDDAWERLYGLQEITFGPECGFLDCNDSDGSVYVRDVDGWRDRIGKEYQGNVRLNGGMDVPFVAKVTDRYVGCLGQSNSSTRYNIDSIDKPNSTYRSYGNVNFRAILSKSQPQCLAGLTKQQMGEDGWKTWIEGPSGYYEPADSRINVKSADRIEWAFTYSDFTAGKDGPYHLKIGKLNPWCGEYVDAEVEELNVVRFRVAGMKMRIVREDDIWTCSFLPNSIARAAGASVDADAAFREKRPDVIAELERRSGLPSGWRKDGDLYQVAFKADTLSFEDVASAFLFKYNNTADRFSFMDADGLRYPRSSAYVAVGRHYSISPYNGYMIDIFSPYCFGTGSAKSYDTKSPSLLRKEDCSEEAYFPWSEP